MPTAASANVWESLRERGLSGTRELSLRAQTLDAESRSFDAVASTETPAIMWDWERGEVIDEVLLARGGEFPDSVPFLRDHYRDCDNVIGSARAFKLEADAGPWVCRCYIATKADDSDRVELYWSRVAEGHLRAVSIGYMVSEFTDIPPGQRKQVAGRFFTAKGRRLRVSTRWQGHELSLTPIGADPMALIRSRAGEPAQPRRSYFR